MKSILTVLLLASAMTLVSMKINSLNEHQKSNFEILNEVNEADSIPFRENAKFLPLYQKSIKDQENPFSGLWLNSTIIENNYSFSRKLALPKNHTNLVSFGLYNFFDSSFVYRNATFKSVESYSGKCSADDSLLILTDYEIEDSHSSAVKKNRSKVWDYEFLNDTKLLLHEDRLNGHSYLLHKIETNKTREYSFEDLRKTLVGNTFTIIDTLTTNINDANDTPSSVFFLNDSIFILLSYPEDFSNKSWSDKVNISDHTQMKQFYRGQYLIDDFSIENEVFLRLSYFKNIRIKSINPELISGTTYSLTKNKVALKKSNYQLSLANFNGAWKLGETIEVTRGFEDCLKSEDILLFNNNELRVEFHNGAVVKYTCKSLPNSLIQLEAKNDAYQNHDFWGERMLVSLVYRDVNEMALKIATDNYFPHAETSYLVLAKQ